MDYAQLKSGYCFESTRIHFGRDEVDTYIQAVEDDSPIYKQNNVVPSMAIAAFALRELLSQLELLPGTVHAGQELNFSGPVGIDQTLTFDGTVAQNATRGGWRFLAVDLSITDSEATAMLSGRSMVMFPLGEH
jgi:hypothetical protein